MRWLLNIQLLLAFGIAAAAQAVVPPQCPNIVLKGPQGITQPGEIVPYSVVKDEKANNFAIQYHWTTSDGEIISGQGTESIKIKWPKSTTLTVTVEFKGLPKDCVASLSETGHWDPPPQPVRIGVLDPLKTGEFEEKLRSFAVEIADHRTNQLYIFVSSARDTNPSTIAEWEQQIKDALPSGLRTRTSITKVTGDRNIIEFWRIQPGADTPKCQECDLKLKCPTISVIGPGGIAMPGETIYFRAAIDADSSSYTQLRWTISDGTILSDQNTLTLAVRMPDMPPVTTTIFVDGLPKDCPNSASNRYDFAVDPVPILVDEFGRLAKDAIRSRLIKFFAELEKNPNNQGFITLYGTEKEMNSSERLILDSINFRSFDRPRITIVRSGKHESGRVYTKLYRIPPGAENPAP